MNENTKRIMVFFLSVLLLLLGYVGYQHQTEIREFLVGASPAVIDPASIGFGGQNRSMNLMNLTNNWRRYNSSFVGRMQDGRNIEIVPWFKRGDQCPLTNDPTNGFRICNNSTGIFVSGNHSNETFCQVTDQGSQVMLADSLGSQNGTRMDNWVNTLEAIHCTALGNLTHWTTGLFYNKTGGGWVVDCGRDTNADSASDADAHFITGLAIINNSIYANSSTKRRAGDLLTAMCIGYATYDFMPYNITNKINPHENISYLPCGGENVCSPHNPANGALMYMGYVGPMLEALAACNAKMGDNRSMNFTLLADNLIQSHLQASNWTGTTFSVGGGYQYHWANYTKVAGVPGTAYSVCDANCIPQPFSDDPDGMRVARICNGAAIWRDLRGVTFRNITTYCQQWMNLVGETGSTHVLERYFDGSAKSSTTDNSYKAAGIGAFMNALVNTSLAASRINAYNSHLNWNGNVGRMGGEACFGVYEKAFGMISLGFLMGQGDSAFTANATNTSTSNLTNSTPAGGTNISISNEAINATVINLTGSIKLNVTVDTNYSVIDKVLAELLFPNSTRQNFTMTRLATTSGGVAVNDSNLIANDTFEDSDHVWTSFGSRINESGDTYINVTSGGVAISRNYSLYSSQPRRNVTTNITLSVNQANYSKVYFDSDCTGATGPRVIYETNGTPGFFRIKHEGGAYCIATTFNTSNKHIVQIFADNTNNQTTFKVLNATTGAQIGATCSANTYYTPPVSTSDCVVITGGTQPPDGWVKIYKVTVYNGSGAALDGSGSGGSTTTNTTSYEVNFTNNIQAGTYNITRIFANTTSGDSTLKNTTLSYTVTSNSTGPIVWVQNIANTSIVHNQTFFTDLNATNASNSTCAVTPQGYLVNNTAVFNNTHRFNDGTILGSAHVNTTGAFKNSFSFDGVDDAIETLNTSELNLGVTSNLTLMAWVRPTTLPTVANHTFRVISKENGSTGYAMYLSPIDDSPRCLFNGLTDTTPDGSSVNVGLDTWNHIACVYDGANISTYVNGVLQINQTSTGNITNSTARLRIGLAPDDTGDFNGSIDGVRIYRRAFTPAEVAAEVASQRPVAANDLLIDYEFEDYNNTHVYDTEMITNYSNGYFDNRTGQAGFSANINKTSFYRFAFTAIDTCSNTITQVVGLNVTNTRPVTNNASLSNTSGAGQNIVSICGVSDSDNDALYINWTVKINNSVVLSNGTSGITLGGPINIYNFTSVKGNNYTLFCMANDSLLATTSTLNFSIGPITTLGNVTVQLCANMSSLIQWRINGTYYNTITRRVVAPGVNWYPTNSSACGYVYNLTLNYTTSVNHSILASTNYSVANSTLTCYNKQLSLIPQAVTTMTNGTSLLVNCSIMLNNTYVFNVSLQNFFISWSDA